MTMNQYIPFNLIEVPSLDGLTTLLGEVCHLWDDGYIVCNPKSCAPHSISEETFKKIREIVEATGRYDPFIGLFPMPEPEPIPKTRSCNRHFDCKEAEEKYYARYPKESRGYIPNFHCHDDECEDCFGC